MRLFWLAIAVIAVVLFSVFMINGQNSQIVSSDQLANTTYLAIIGLLASSMVLASGITLKQVIRKALIWLVIIYALVIGYNNRHALQDVAHRLTPDMIPASPLSTQKDSSQVVTLIRTQERIFETTGLVNNQPVLFIIDTGVASVVLSYADAQRIGINTTQLRYATSLSTARGIITAAPVMLDSLKIGHIIRHNVQAMVARMDVSIDNYLGNSFLNRLSDYKLYGDRLIFFD